MAETINYNADTESVVQLDQNTSTDKPKKKTTNESKENLFHIIGNDIKGWRKNRAEILNYKPDPEKIVQLHQDKPKRKTTATELTETNNTIDKNTKYLNESNFRFQIGKMQEDGGTIYSDEMLKIGIEYMINHTKEGEHSIIQIRSDVGDLLQQGSEEGVLSSEQQKERIENIIKENFGEKGESIKVIIGSQQYPEVFEALQQGKDGIIPKEEPNIRKYLSTTSKEELSPLPIIQYLAYHANNCPELMQLFYNTKPKKYIDEDSKLGKKPGDSNADFYGIVEVGLRLTEVLKGISIQGGVGRQRVYDKIISIIINGEDIIGRNEQFDCQDTLQINKFKALKNLHNIIKETLGNTGNNIDFKQLYIELNRSGLDRIEKKLKEKKELENKKERRKNIVDTTVFALVVALSIGVPYKLYTDKQKKIEQSNIEFSEQQKEQEMILEIMHRYPYYDSLRTYMDRHPGLALYELNNPNSDLNKNAEYLHKQRRILRSAYDLSKFNYINNGVEYNKIIDEYDRITAGNYRTYGKYPSAEDFMKNYIEILAGKGYYIEFQEQYAHRKKYKQYIENTLKYGDKIDISKYKVEEKEVSLPYYIEQEDQPYILKFVRVYLHNNQTRDLILAAKGYRYPEEEFTLKNGLICIKDLVGNHGKDIGISNIE